MGQTFAYYTPGMLWKYDDHVKNFLLLFDGIALTAPTRLHDQIIASRPWITEALDAYGCLKLLDPATIWLDDQRMSFLEDLEGVLVNEELVESLRRAQSFRSITISSRFSPAPSPAVDAKFMTDYLLEMLLSRDIYARRRTLDEYDWLDPDIDGVDLPTLAHTLVKTLWTNSFISAAKANGLTLYAATDDPYTFGIPQRLLLSAGDDLVRVFESDLMSVGVDLTYVPLNEILDFKSAHRAEIEAYMSDLRTFCFLRANASSGLRNRERRFSQGLADVLDSDSVDLASRAAGLREQALRLRQSSKMAFGSRMVDAGIALAATLAAVVEHSPVAALIAGAQVARHIALSPHAPIVQFSYLALAGERLRYDPWN